MSYQFDYGNRLRNVIGYEGTYAYDAYGRRIQQTNSSGTIDSFYDHTGQLVYQQDRSGGFHDYLYLGGHLVAIRDYNASGVATAMRYQHTDALGSIIRQSDKDGNGIAGTYLIYDAWGNLREGTQAQDGPGYTGHVMDASTGLTYMQQRYYDPDGLHFLSMDPVDASSTDGSNLDRYWYANDNPYRFIDPDGRGSCGAGGAGVDCPHEKQAKILRQREETITGSHIPGNTAGNEVRVIQVNPVGNIVHNETSGLRPSTQNGAGSSEDLHQAKFGIAHVILNREEAGDSGGVASDKVSAREMQTSQYKDAQTAAAEAIRSPDPTGGSKHFYLDYGQPKPSWANGKVTTEYGPFQNAAGGGDVPRDADVQIVIVHPEGQ